MFVILWRFRPKPQRVSEFLEHYRPHGSWAQLFAQGSGYRGTELLRDREDPSSFITIDRWETELAWNDFQQQYAAQYAELDHRCAGLTDSEQHLGTYTDDISPIRTSTD